MTDAPFSFSEISIAVSIPSTFTAERTLGNRRFRDLSIDSSDVSDAGVAALTASYEAEMALLIDKRHASRIVYRHRPILRRSAADVAVYSRFALY